MNIFFSPCYKVSAYCGTLVISIWVNYRLLGNFAATIFVCVCVCVGWGHVCVKQQIATGVLQEFLKHAFPDYLVRGTDLFSLRLSS